jgi:hypothetical protein
MLVRAEFAKAAERIGPEHVESRRPQPDALLTRLTDGKPSTRPVVRAATLAAHRPTGAASRPEVKDAQDKVEDFASTVRAIFEGAANAEEMEDCYQEVWTVLRVEISEAVSAMFPDPARDRQRAVTAAALASLLKVRGEPTEKQIRSAFASAERRVDAASRASRKAPRGNAK